MPISLKSTVGGGGSTPIGSLTVYANSMPIDFTQDDGSRFLRTGFIETDTSKFDNTLFAQSVATYWDFWKDTITTGQPPVMMASNGAGILVSIYGEDTQSGGYRRSIDNGLTFSSFLTFALSAGNSPTDIIWVQSLSLFIVVCSEGTIFTSPDGTAWTNRVSGFSGALRSLHWNGSLLVAVGASGAISTSSNGTSWTPRTSVITGNITNVVYGSGVWFITGGFGSNLSASSPDGINWTVRTIDSSISGVTQTGCLIYDGTRFVMVGSVGGIYTSTNGSSWVKTNDLQTATYIEHNAGTYVINGGSSSGSVFVSSNLLQWKSVKTITGVVGEVFRLKFVNNIWVGVSTTNVGFQRGNGYLFSGWPYLLRESNVNDLTVFGIYYMRVS